MLGFVFTKDYDASTFFRDGISWYFMEFRLVPHLFAISCLHLAVLAATGRPGFDLKTMHCVMDPYDLCSI